MGFGQETTRAGVPPPSPLRIPKPLLPVAYHEFKIYTGGGYHLVAKTFFSFSKRGESIYFIEKLFFSRRLPWQKKE